MDSVTILFAMLESGRKPRCYTFYCKGYPSEDLISSQKLCAHFGVEHIPVPVPIDHDRIVADVRVLIAKHQASKIKKTIIQCMHPWLYLCPAMLKRGEDHVFTGFAAGNYYNLSRRDQKALRELGEEEFTKRGWRHHYFDHLEFVDGNCAYLSKHTYGIQMDDVYACDPIAEWFRSYTIDDSHRAEDGSRLQKASAIYAFEDYYNQGEFYRRGASYQVNSKLREFHDGLLWNERYNPGGKWKHIIAIYNAIAAGKL